MLSIFDFDSYKEHLISYYYHECDNNIFSREKRKTILETQYTDEFLLEIIENTERFIKVLIERTANSDRTFIEFEIWGEHNYIFTNCTGGWSPDKLIPIFSDVEDAYISKYLLSDFLGKDFRIDFDANVEEIIDDEDDDIIIGGIYYTPKMIIVGDLKTLSEKYNKLQREKEVLKRSLKKDDGHL